MHASHTAFWLAHVEAQHTQHLHHAVTKIVDGSNYIEYFKGILNFPYLNGFNILKVLNVQFFLNFLFNY